MSTNKMWGGRFESGPAAIMREITPSIDFDKRLAGEDLAGSRHIEHKVRRLRHDSRRPGAP